MHRPETAEKSVLLPDEAACERMARRYGMPENIWRHSMRVRDVAKRLALELKKAGQDIDLQLVEAAALLHDITKARGIKTGEDHSETGRKLLEALGYPEVGRVVGNHVILHIDTDPRKVTEDEVVNYADKRVMHDRIVSLGERFQDLRARYGKTEQALRFLDFMESQAREMGKKIFSLIDIEPADIREDNI